MGTIISTSLRSSGGVPWGLAVGASCTMPVLSIVLGASVVGKPVTRGMVLGVITDTSVRVGARVMGAAVVGESVVGVGVGTSVGAADGWIVGNSVGASVVGVYVGANVVGVTVGSWVGACDGEMVAVASDTKGTAFGAKVNVCGASVGAGHELEGNHAVCDIMVGGAVLSTAGISVSVVTVVGLAVGSEVG